MKNTFFILICVTALVALSSSSPDDKGINELPKGVRKQYAFVPSGKVFIGNDSLEVSSFYLLKTEICNLTYREFISDLKKNGKQDDLVVANIDSTKWTNENFYNEPYVNYYHNYSAYNFYPAVNMSYEGATLFCKWLAEKLNSAYSHYYTFDVRLPTEIEWLRAAQHGDRKAVYAWEGGPYLRNSRGMELCNYKNIGDENIKVDSGTHKYIVTGIGTNDNADITTPIYSYYPNKFGLYNMNGNVAEMVSEKGIAVGGSWNSTGYDVRNESTMSYTEPSPFVGFRPVLIVTKK